MCVRGIVANVEANALCEQIAFGLDGDAVATATAAAVSRRVEIAVV